MTALRRIDPPGLLFGAMGVGALLLPFLHFRPNRIVLGDAVHLGPFYVAMVSGLLAIGMLRLPQWARLGSGVAGAMLLVWLAGALAAELSDGAPAAARVSPASGAWLGLAAFVLLIADALSKMRLALSLRMAALALACGAVAGLLLSGHLAQISVLQEYAARRDVFAAQSLRHLTLAFGSLVGALIVGLPLGLLLYHERRLRTGVMGILNLLQTTPSLALFGMMIPLLSWVAANVPGAAEMGIAGIGFAPALIALFLYSLLPVVGNTVVGLDNASPLAREAARGMGMTPAQVLARVSIPLALPVIMAAVRIVLVQNIGLAVIAGLIGGGGYGTFVFQGLNQTATDLILLGAVPTVAMALVAGIALDLAAEAFER